MDLKNEYIYGKETYQKKVVEEAKRDGLREFIPYVEQISSDSVKDFTWTCLENAPKYFWVIPAAVSEKRHPPFAHDFGGLKRHTIAAHYFGDNLCKAFDVEGVARDLILCAIDLHDTCKKGVKEYDEKYYRLHHILPRLRYEKYIQRHTSPRRFNAVMDLIEAHMGGSRIIDGKLPINSRMTLGQKIVYLADYTASRPNIDFKFE